MQSNRHRTRGVLPLALFLGALTLCAQPQLTEIQDVVYRADGQPLDGFAAIQWQSFLAADSSSIAAYSKNVRIIRGVLAVSLVPTTNASTGAYYMVRLINNAGRIQSTEYWGVRPSSVPLKLKDVRLVGPPLGGQPVNSPIVAPSSMTIPDIVGLSDELTARTKKGLGFAPSRAIVSNSNGDLDGVVGEPTDCVLVNGTSGACGTGGSGGGPGFVDQETPAGLINGTNDTFTLANAPDPTDSLELYLNGLLLRKTVDYTISSNTITFLSGTLPQSGDLVTASYRMAGTGAQTGGQTAGGALAGYFPAPSLAAGAVANQHVAGSAGITESKLALNYPTHAPVNDPTADQKAALTGTSGTPSNSNRFVTDQDSRLSDTRLPAGHGLLATAHFDSNPSSVSRGDLIVGIGTAPSLWSRLPLGAPNRCLISNGFDAVWNACLFTGFPTGSIPFVDSQGTLAYNNTRLYWDNSGRRLAIGSNSPSATLTVHDSSASTGITTVAVRAGDGQLTTSLQRWQDASSNDLARMESDGTLMAAAVRTTSTSTRPAWQETGTSADPATPTDGSQWLNTTEQSRKSFEAGQKHTQPQVICSAIGGATTSSSMTALGRCHIPASMIQSGDRFEVRYDLSHEGGSVAFDYNVMWGSQILSSRSASAGEAYSSGVCNTSLAGSAVYWNWQSWGSSSSALAGSSWTGSVPSGAVDVEVRALLSTGGVETVTLRNLTVIRYPSVTNIN